MCEQKKKSEYISMCMCNWIASFVSILQAQQTSTILESEYFHV